MRNLKFLAVVVLLLTIFNLQTDGQGGEPDVERKDKTSPEMSIRNLFHSIKDKNLPVDDFLRTECQRMYGRSDGQLSISEFRRMLGDLFCNSEGKPYALSDQQVEQLFNVFDADRNGLLCDEEFRAMWSHWLRVILWPTPALLVVDVQNDFISGSLALSHCPAGEDGAEVVPVVNGLLSNPRMFRRVVYTQDWHPQDHISFVDNVDKRELDPNVDNQSTALYSTVKFACGTVQTLWPAHCVQGSWGAQFHKDLKILRDALYIRKGTDPDVDSYSAFWDNLKTSDTGLAKDLKRFGITDTYVVGLAYDVCVAYTARHALELEFRTVVVEDACRGVNASNVKAVRQEMRDAGALVVNSQEVADLASGRDRRPEPALRHALALARANNTADD